MRTSQETYDYLTSLLFKLRIRYCVIEGRDYRTIWFRETMMDDVTFKLILHALEMSGYPLDFNFLLNDMPCDFGDEWDIDIPRESPTIELNYNSALWSINNEN